MVPLIQLLLAFALCSILAVGGGTAVLPAMHRIIVTQNHWLTDAQFRNIYSIGQVAPGPNMLMVLLIGFQLSGWPGMFTAGFGFFAPSCTLTLVVNRFWVRMGNWPWRLSIQRGLAPVAIGLMMSGTYSIGKLSIRDIPTCGIAIAVLAILMWKHINPALLVLLGGAAYVLLQH
ncbi:MAG TPA: chromate transporter [Candidatus Binataceae bacterium]|nr:chromate transporter [Candidatus Binataceae bacterium]